MNLFAVQVRRKLGARWGEATYEAEQTIEGCGRWPRGAYTGVGGSEETTDRSDTVTTGWVLSAPVDSGIGATDQVQMPDDPTWWDVVGDPQPYADSPFSDWKPGVPITLTRTEG